MNPINLRREYVHLVVWSVVVKRKAIRANSILTFRKIKTIIDYEIFENMIKQEIIEKDIGVTNEIIIIENIARL